MSTTRILIVEDEPNMVSGLRDNFEFEGFEVSTALDGVAGLELALKNGPDLVILDLNLPKRDGLAVLAAMRAGSELRRIPVVIFSTSKLSKDITRSYELGANCYISKPGNLADFFSMMRTIEHFWFGSVSLPPREE